MCFYRRRDLPSPLIQLADKHQCKYLAFRQPSDFDSIPWGGATILFNYYYYRAHGCVCTSPPRS